MVHVAALDVSVAETSICIVDDHGKIARERKVPTEPEAIIEALNGFGQECERIGLEAGPLSQCLYGELAEAACQSSASRRGTSVQCSRRRSTRPTATMRAASPR